MRSRAWVRLTSLLLVAGTVAAQTVSAQSGQGKPASKPNADIVARSGPAWGELSAAQRKALAPLAAQWSQLSDLHKRKWLALAKNFDRLPQADQQRLHARMGEWIALSPADRARARLNFADAQQLPSDERRAKWEAYNALSDEDKRRLAQRVPAPPSGAAVAARPVPEGRLARLPQARGDERTPPRIAAGPEQLDHNTLLPATPVQ